MCLFGTIGLTLTCLQYLPKASPVDQVIVLRNAKFLLSFLVCVKLMNPQTCQCHLQNARRSCRNILSVESSGIELQSDIVHMNDESNRIVKTTSFFLTLEVKEHGDFVNSDGGGDSF